MVLGLGSRQLLHRAQRIELSIVEQWWDSSPAIIAGVPSEVGLAQVVDLADSSSRLNIETEQQACCTVVVTRVFNVVTGLMD